jgi:AcrR family transcriptional regulator
MTPRVSARSPAPAKASLRGADARDGSATRAGRKGRPASRPAGDEVRRASPGRMRKGETPKERGEQTRARIADAVIDLLTETELPPTAKEVATRAGVSVRLVFHHFEDMDALYRAVARAQFDRHWRGLRPVAGDLPVGQRIDRTVHQRARLFDAVAPVRRKAATLALRHQDIAQSFELTNKMLRNWLEETFADELRTAGRSRPDLLAALEAAASWEMWDRLRRIQGLSAAAARRVVARTLRSLLNA